MNAGNLDGVYGHVHIHPVSGLDGFSGWIEKRNGVITDSFQGDVPFYHTNNLQGFVFHSGNLKGWHYNPSHMAELMRNASNAQYVNDGMAIRKIR